MSLPRIGVVGATGYAGAELTRLLLAHPKVSLQSVVSRGRAGERFPIYLWLRWPRKRWVAGSRIHRWR